MSYAKAFRIIRAACGLSQTEIAALMDVSASQISLIESGRRQPSLDALHALARVTGAPAAIVTLLASSEADLQKMRTDEFRDLAYALLRFICLGERRIKVMARKGSGKELVISMTRSRLRICAQTIMDAINKAQGDGFTIDEVLMASLYACGAAIGQRGGELLLDRPIRDALPPLVLGYTESPLTYDEE